MKSKVITKESSVIHIRKQQKITAMADKNKENENEIENVPEQIVRNECLEDLIEHRNEVLRF